VTVLLFKKVGKTNREKKRVDHTTYSSRSVKPMEDKETK